MLWHSVLHLTRAAPAPLYPLSLHDALPISERKSPAPKAGNQPSRKENTCSSRIANTKEGTAMQITVIPWKAERDRKSTRLNSSHVAISYAVFCLKKKTRPRYSTKATHRHSVLLLL